MPGYTKFDAEIYSEDLQPVTEQEFDEVMQAIAEESDWQGYGEWSAQIDRQPSIENFVIVNGEVRHRPEPKSLGRIGGIEL
jgi:hypothetical protein